MTSPAIATPEYIRACEAATLAFVAVTHLENLDGNVAALRDRAMQASFAAASQAAELVERCPNLFENRCVCLATDVLAGCDELAAQIKAVLAELQPINDKVQALQEQAHRAITCPVVH